MNNRNSPSGPVTYNVIHASKSSHGCGSGGCGSSKKGSKKSLYPAEEFAIALC